MKTTPLLFGYLVLLSFVLTPISARAGLLDFINSFGEKKRELVDKSQSHYRQGLEQSGIREEEMRARQNKEPVVSDAEHRRNVARLKREYEDALDKLLVSAAKLEEKRRRATSAAERRKIDQEIDRRARQIPSIEQEIRNHGGNPMDTHLAAGEKIDELRRTSRNNTPMTEDAADIFFPGFGGLSRNAADRSRRDAQQAAQNAGRSGGAPGRVTVAKPKPKTTTKAPRRMVRRRPGHNPAEGHHH